MPPQVVSPNELTVGRVVHGAYPNSFLYADSNGFLTSYTFSNFTDIVVNGLATFNGAIDVNGTINLANGIGTTGWVLTSQGNAAPIWTNITAATGIQNIIVSPAPEEYNIFSPIGFTTNESPAGTINIIQSYGTQNQNLFWASPADETGTPRMRIIDNEDLPTSGATAGTYPVANVTINSKGIVTGITSTTSNFGTPVNQALVKYVRNNSGTPINKGQVVYVTGSSGAFLTVALANAASESTSTTTIAVAMENIGNNSNGYVINVGIIDGINTNHLTEGQQLWLSTTNGEMTTTRPTQPAHGVLCGYCVKQAPGSAGILYIKIINYIELEELHDVLITNPQNNQVLQYGSATSLWTNTSNLNLGIITANHFIGTNLTIQNGATIQGLTVGRGGGSVAGNTLTGAGNALANNTSGTQNAAFGWSALASNTTEGSNSAFGYDAGAFNKASQTTIMGARAMSGSATTSNTGNNNSVFGFGAGRYIASGDNTAMGQGALAGNPTTFSTGTGQNVAIGKDSMASNQTGNTNTAIGRQSLYANTTGNANVAIGNNALFSSTTAGNNTALGAQAMFYVTTQGFQVAVGNQALAGNSNTTLNTGQLNTAVGYAAGAANTSGSFNVFVGHLTGTANTSGNSNTFVGSYAGQNNTTGFNNTFIGGTAGGNNRSGINNTVIGLSAANQLFTGSSNCYLGRQAAYYNISGSDNIAIGENAIFQFETSSNQIAIGRNALFGNATRALNTGYDNVAIGYAAGSAVTSGIGNVLIGHLAGDTLTTGVSNIIIGNQADGTATANYQIALGQLVIPTASNFGAWGGNTNSTRTDLGVGTYSPNARVHVETLSSSRMGLIVQGSVGQTADLFEINNSASQNHVVVTGIGSVGLNTSLPTQNLDINGNARLRAGFYDGNNSVGLANSVLTSTGSATQWVRLQNQIIGYGTQAPSASLGQDGDFFVVYV